MNNTRTFYGTDRERREQQADHTIERAEYRERWGHDYEQFVVPVADEFGRCRTCRLPVASCGCAKEPSK